MRNSFVVRIEDFFLGHDTKENWELVWVPVEMRSGSEVARLFA